MSQQTTDPGRGGAWGDAMMPEEAARRQDPRATPPPTPLPTPREDAKGDAAAAAPAEPEQFPGYNPMPLGPGNEAMEGGASPAPRGYTGGAMGKFAAGLSPSFADVARGSPAPGGDRLYTDGEAATTFGPGSGIAHPSAQPPPDRVEEQPPSQRPNALDTPTDSGTG